MIASAGVARDQLQMGDRRHAGPVAVRDFRIPERPEGGVEKLFDGGPVFGPLGRDREHGILGRNDERTRVAG